MTHYEKINDAGEMHTIHMDGITTYIIYTNEGFFRGGKKYFADKVFRVLSWEVQFIYEKNGFDIYETLSSADGDKNIPAGVAHIFKSLTDSVILEYFPEGTQSEDFERYRQWEK